MFRRMSATGLFGLQSVIQLRRGRADRNSPSSRARPSFGPSRAARTSASSRAPSRFGPPRRAARSSVVPRLLDRAARAPPPRARRPRRSSTPNPRRGAVRMTIRPGDMTIVDIETTLFPRANLEHVGLGGMGSTYLFGPNDRRGVDDARPAVHKSTGLQMLNGHGEWLWRPLHNPETLQISAFLDKQSARLRPLAARPRLRRIPGRRPAFRAAPEPVDRADRRVGTRAPSSSSRSRPNSEVNDNILAYWRPKAADAGRRRGLLRLPPVLVLAAARSPAARHGRGDAHRARHRADAGAASSSTSPARRWPRPDRRDLRARAHRRAREPFRALQALALSGAQDAARGFELDPATKTPARCASCLRQAGKPISETWLYRWTP